MLKTPRTVRRKIIGQINIAEIIGQPPITRRIVETQGWQIGTKTEETEIITIIITTRITKDKITRVTFKITATRISEEIIEAEIIISKIDLTTITRITITIQMVIIITEMVIIKARIGAVIITIITGRTIIGEITITL